MKDWTHCARRGPRTQWDSGDVMTSSVAGGLGSRWDLLWCHYSLALWPWTIQMIGSPWVSLTVKWKIYTSLTSWWDFFQIKKKHFLTFLLTYNTHMTKHFYFKFVGYWISVWLLSLFASGLLPTPTPPIPLTLSLPVAFFMRITNRGKYYVSCL